MSNWLNPSRSKHIYGVHHDDAGLNLIKAHVLDTSFLHSTSQCDTPDIRSAYGTKMMGSGTMRCYLNIGEICARLTVGIVDELFVGEILERIFIERPIGPIHSAEKLQFHTTPCRYPS